MVLYQGLLLYFSLQDYESKLLIVNRFYYEQQQDNIQEGIIAVNQLFYSMYNLYISRNFS